MQNGAPGEGPNGQAMMQDANGAPATNPAMAGAAPETTTEAPQDLRRKPGKLRDALAKAAKARTVKAIGEIEEAKLVRATDSNRQLQEVLVDFW